MKVLGRMSDGGVDPRAEAVPLLIAVAEEFSGGAIGELRGDLFRSTGTMDRGGVVLRLGLRDDASSFLPHAVETPDGIEIHMAGELEGRALVRVLRSLMRLAEMEGLMEDGL